MPIESEIITSTPIAFNMMNATENLANDFSRVLELNHILYTIYRPQKFVNLSLYQSLHMSSFLQVVLILKSFT